MPDKDKGGSTEGSKKCPWWPYAVFFFIIALLVGMSISQHQNVSGVIEKNSTLKQALDEASLENTGLEKKLVKTQNDLSICNGKLLNEPTCPEERKPVHRPRPRPKLYKAPPPAPEPVKQVEVKKAFDANMCGAGTEPMIRRETNEPYCRAIPAPVVVQSAPPPPQIIVERAAPQLPPGCYRDQWGQTMCPRPVQQVVVTPSIFPLFSGYVERPQYVETYREHHQHREYQRPQPRYEERPQYHPPAAPPIPSGPSGYTRPPSGPSGYTRPPSGPSGNTAAPTTGPRGS